ncbi:hypothetical protein AMECASPLE_033730 [Ameca splendens]|uniref:Uncharacterized protein n=1 Tax=Ameca splendens TaxID=208324 RepID=A0ABV0XVQ8_9TELE
MVTWIGGGEEGICNQIEQSETRGTPLSTLPFVESKPIAKLNIGNEWIKLTLKVWMEVKKMLKDTGSISRALPTVGNIEFPPPHEIMDLGDGLLKVLPSLISCLKEPALSLFHR